MAKNRFIKIGTGSARSPALAFFLGRGRRSSRLLVAGVLDHMAEQWTSLRQLIGQSTRARMAKPRDRALATTMEELSCTGPQNDTSCGKSWTDRKGQERMVAVLEGQGDHERADAETGCVCGRSMYRLLRIPRGNLCRAAGNHGRNSQDISLLAKAAFAHAVATPAVWPHALPGPTPRNADVWRFSRRTGSRFQVYSGQGCGCDAGLLLVLHVRTDIFMCCQRCRRNGSMGSERRS